jgi:hypothetical protein
MNGVGGNWAPTTDASGGEGKPYCMLRAWCTPSCWLEEQHTDGASDPDEKYTGADWESDIMTSVQCRGEMGSKSLNVQVGKKSVSFN